MKKILLFIVLITGFAGLYACKSETKHPDISQVSFQLITGEHLKLSQLKGRPVIVTFWATTCVACIREIPDLLELYHQYSAQGLEIIAVAMPYDRPDHVLEFSQARKLPYPVALDIDAKVVRSFGNVKLTPNNFLINPDNQIQHHQIGILDKDKTIKWLQATLSSRK
ncbi:MAG: TlpA family protein disulfide reductase [Gammaproteobacteria bacterium]|nr:TlpA family protein disulfide reductase [Gammaproteobacteria bacterium]